MCLMGTIIAITVTYTDALPLFTSLTEYRGGRRPYIQHSTVWGEKTVKLYNFSRLSKHTAPTVSGPLVVTIFLCMIHPICLYKLDLKRFGRKMHTLETAAQTQFPH